MRTLGEIKSIWDIPFIVVDVETSGSNPASNRIIEIACVTTLGGEIISKYTTLVNPHQFIPPFIANMTGISNEMVFAAPEIEEVFPEIDRIFKRKDAVFAAHNARFDWSFVSEFFNSSNAEIPKIPKLCTLKLAKRILPKEPKKNVGSLAKHFNIEIKNRHRALGDALATAFILIELLQLAEAEHNIQTIDELLFFQNRQIKNFKAESANYTQIKESLKELPEEPGVYRFYDKSDSLLYIGKAKSLKDRVKTYFYDETVTSKKISDMIKKIHRVSWETTGTELSALLLESKLIKTEKPPFNTASKSYRRFPFIKLSNENYPRLEMVFTADDDGSEYFGPFQSPTLVEEILLTLEKQFKIRKCEKEIIPSPEERPCFYYHIKKCDAPCSDLISLKGYQKEIDKVKYFLRGFNDGIITQLEQKMHQFAEALNFEKANKLKIQIAELKKLFERKYNLPTSVNSSNMILIHPAYHSEEQIEMFFIRTGKLHSQEIFFRNDKLHSIFGKVKDIYFNGYNDSLSISLEEANDIRIITAWTYRNKHSSFFIYPDGKSINEVYREIEEILNSDNLFPDIN